MERDRAGLNRRGLLRGAAGASAGAGLAAVAGADQAQAYNPGQDEIRSRYRESEHVKAFYLSNRYESKIRNQPDQPAAPGVAGDGKGGGAQ